VHCIPGMREERADERCRRALRVGGRGSRRRPISLGRRIVGLRGWSFRRGSSPGISRGIGWSLVFDRLAHGDEESGGTSERRSVEAWVR
jgi:hypothetical protein